VPDEEARAALVAREENGGLRFDIRLQGDGETAFFDV
jgi:protocatechuate 3,4-dioxygenase alpha subunit